MNINKMIDEILDTLNDINPDDELNAIKADVAWVCGIDEYCDDWDALLNI